MTDFIPLIILILLYWGTLNLGAQHAIMTLPAEDHAQAEQQRQGCWWIYLLISAGIVITLVTGISP